MEIRPCSSSLVDFHDESSASARRRPRQISTISKNANGETKPKHSLSPRSCWLRLLVFVAICLFFVGLYYAWSTLNVWSKSNGALSSEAIDNKNFEQSIKSEEISKSEMFPNINIDRTPISFNCDREMFDTKREINELLRIKQSVLNELRSLEEKRNVIRTEITILLTQSEKLQTELQQGVKDLEKIAISIEQAKTAHRETVERNMPEIYLPRKLARLPANLERVGDFSREIGGNGSRACSMDTCFDYSRCSFVNGFSYTLLGLRPNLHNSLNMVETLSRQSSSPTCLILINGTSTYSKKESITNRVVLFDDDHQSDSSLFLNTDIKVGSTFKRRDFRLDFDVIIPPIASPVDVHFWKRLPTVVPARRRYLLSFAGKAPVGEEANLNFVVKFLRLLENTTTADVFKIDLKCATLGGGAALHASVSSDDWSLCSNETARNDLSRHSTFSLVFIPSTYISTTNVQIRLIEAIKYGSIPVIISSTYLPFQEVLDWRKCSLMLPASRITELQYLIRSFGDSDILELRRNGRLYYEKYFRDDVTILRTLMAMLRHRLLLPPSPVIRQPESRIYFNETFQPTVAEVTQQSLLDSEEYIGPVEPPLPSARFQHNFSALSLTAYESWNVYANALSMYEFNPFLMPMPSEAKFEGSQFGFRPINNGAGGSGKEFSESLGGNFPREQFTVILLTYEREQVLLAALARLHHLPYLNKVIVVWNGPTPPAIDAIWPKISVPIVIIKSDKNSLNNRFLPFAEIETEAVLSMDDDVHLRHDEIIFGFRVWREARDRVVGFPGRFHGWDSQSHRWAYNSNHSCELSMVLTGAAFLHKYYLHLYSNEMLNAIRAKVDELMNCEDIAMNFLVSHVTRKPPIKVTSRWTFRCPGCPETLSADDSHFNERHECINFFTQVYGYNPLLYTQFRVDSVLFKTKIPQNHQKCFKFI